MKYINKFISDINKVNSLINESFSNTLSLTILKESLSDMSMRVDKFFQTYMDIYNNYSKHMLRDIGKLHLEISSILDNPDNRNILNSFDDSFTIDSYKYNINLLIPNFKPLVKLELRMMDYIRTSDDLNKIGERLREGILSDIDQKKKELRNNIINNSKHLTDDEFINKTFSIHRGNKTESIRVRVDDDFIYSIFIRNKNFPKISESLKNNRNDLMYHYTKMMDLFKDLKMNLLKMEILDDNRISNAKEFYTSYFKLMNYAMTNILRAYVEKMQAVKEMLQDDYMVINRILASYNKNRDTTE